ncbi:MAG: hypothetical protein M2R45_01895 [Verrucomicrobia subdivision 3 bacterium]|nr:hypothetical protein [Limisphaerales bacterium]MCS1415693.1 hypothetical protein [Limisphaerales bacterium]
MRPQGETPKRARTADSLSFIPILGCKQTLPNDGAYLFLASRTNDNILAYTPTIH